MANHCILCIKPVAERTALCTAHLEGFKVACHMLRSMRRPTIAAILTSLIHQPQLLPQPIRNVGARHGQSKQKQ
jgi:hypothetical protein